MGNENLKLFTIRGKEVEPKRLYDVIVYNRRQAVAMWRPDLWFDQCVQVIYWEGGVAHANPKDVEFIRLYKNEKVL